MNSTDIGLWWPSADPAAFRAAAAAERARACVYDDVRSDCARMFRELGGSSAAVWGPAAAAVDAAAAVARSRALYADAVADAVADTRAVLLRIAGDADAEVHDIRAQAPPGDPAAGFRADLVDQRARAVAGDAADRAVERVTESARTHSSELVALDRSRGSDPAEGGPPSGDATLGHGPMGGAAIGGAGIGAIAAIGHGLWHQPARYGAVEVRGGAPVPPDELVVRLREVLAGVTGASREWVRLAIAKVTDDAGRPLIVLGTNELDGYVRAGVELRDDELVAGNEEWPEASIASFCAARGLTAGLVVAAHPLPDDLADHLRDSGFEVCVAPDAWPGRFESEPHREEGGDGDAPGQQSA